MKQVHEFAKLFPALEGEEFAALCADIKAHGLQNPIVLFEGKVLDGRNRDRACEKVNVKPRYEPYEGKDAFAYVISQNVLRRHLTPSQRAVIALELEKRFAAEAAAKPRGGDHKSAKSKLGSGPTLKRDLDKEGITSRSKAAKALHIGPNLVQDAKRLAKEAPDVIPAVRAGRVTVGEALTNLRNARAHEAAIKRKHAEVKKYLQKNDRQVAEYLGDCKWFVQAVNVAIACAERFSAPEAQRFIVRRHDEIREALATLERKVKNAKAA